MAQADMQTDVLRRLKKVEGQVAGLRRMVEDGKYCIDVLQQVAAVHGALTQAGKIIIRNHLQTCVKSALESGDVAKGEQVIAELEDVFARYARR